MKYNRFISFGTAGMKMASISLFRRILSPSVRRFATTAAGGDFKSELLAEEAHAGSKICAKSSFYSF